MDELTLELDPKLCEVLAACFELFEDLEYLIDAFGWVAELDLSSDDTCTAGEDPVVSSVVKDHDIVLIDIGDIYRQDTKDRVDLLRGEPALVKVGFVLGTKGERTLLGVLPRVDIGIFWIGGRGSVEHPADLTVSLFELFPLLFAE